MFKICQNIWKEERLPKTWNKAVIIPMHKKGDKINYKNHR